MFLESRIFLLLSPEWAGVIVSATALIFAVLGYLQLIKSKIDTENQIQSLAKQAIETGKVAEQMAAMAMMQKKQNEAIRKNFRPRLRFDKSSSGNNYIGVYLTNLGGRIEILTASYTPEYLLFVCPENGKSVEAGATVHFQWSIVNPPPGWNQKVFSVNFSFNDIYGFTYQQTITRTVKHHAEYFDLTESEEVKMEST